MDSTSTARPPLEDEQWERLALEERAWRVKFRRVGRVAVVCGLVGLCVMWLRWPLVALCAGVAVAALLSRPRVAWRADG